MQRLATKDPDVALEYRVDAHDDLIPIAKRDTVYADTDVVQAEVETGYYYVASGADAQSGGRTARNYPQAWPRANGETVQDGSIIWTATHPAAASVPSIIAAVWTVPSGVTKDSQTEVGAVAAITLSGGTDGVDYEITVRLTYSDGRIIERTYIVPVRSD